MVSPGGSQTGSFDHCVSCRLPRSAPGSTDASFVKGFREPCKGINTDRPEGRDLIHSFHRVSISNLTAPLISEMCPHGNPQASVSERVATFNGYGARFSELSGYPRPINGCIPGWI